MIRRLVSLVLMLTLAMAGRASACEVGQRGVHTAAAAQDHHARHGQSRMPAHGDQKPCHDPAAPADCASMPACSAHASLAGMRTTPALRAPVDRDLPELLLAAVDRTTAPELPPPRA
jgi:hypothetical protein